MHITPRCTRTRGKRRGTMEHVFIKVRANMSATRAVHFLCSIAVNGVARAGFGSAVNVSVATRPNPTFNADVPWAALRARPRAAG